MNNKDIEDVDLLVVGGGKAGKSLTMGEGLNLLFDTLDDSPTAATQRAQQKP